MTRTWLLAVTLSGLLASPSWAQILSRSSSSRSTGVALVSVEELAPAHRDTVSKLLTSPSLVAHAPTEEFISRPEVYNWLLEHPDRVAQAWKKLGVACLPVTTSGPGRFRCEDGQGGVVTWETVQVKADRHVWYAQGTVRAAPHLPLISVRAVAVLRHNLTHLEDGTAQVRQQVDVFLSTDSRAAAMVMRLFGPTMPRLAEQGAGQLLLFFSGIARFIHKHPNQVESLFTPE